MRRQTIYHELSHYIQFIGNIHLTNSIEITEIEFNSNEKLNRLKTLGVTLVDLNYYFSTEEYATHVDTLCINLWKTYCNYPKKQIWTFISDLHKSILNNEKFEESELFKLYHEVNGDISGLIMLIAAKLLNIKYEKIIQTIKTFLIRMDKKTKQ